MDQIENKEEFIPSPIQVKFASYYLNIEKKLTRTEIAKKIGISRRTIYTWLANPGFRSWLNSKKMELVNESLIDILKTAVRKAKSGHYLFAKLILEMAGVYQPGLKLDTGETELIKIEVVQAQAQQQVKEVKEDSIESQNS